MLSITRPLLCWDARESHTGTWDRSRTDSYWRPRLSHYPDTKLLRTGDIVLFQPSNPSLSQRFIQAYQSGPFTHAAIYIEADYLLCEASAAEGKVVFSSLEDSLEKNCILIRRVANVSAEGRARMAEFATSLLSEKYDFWPLLYKVLVRAKPVKQTLKQPDLIDTPLICSTLCEHSILAGVEFGQSITKRNGHLIMPQDLAASPLLEDVAVTWRLVQC